MNTYASYSSIHTTLFIDLELYWGRIFAVYNFNQILINFNLIYCAHTFYIIQYNVM